MTEVAISVRGVRKHFKRRTVSGGFTTFKTQLLNVFSARKREQFKRMDIEVLKGVDLEVPKGKTLGIIGQNGSGKSTLLKLLTGIYAPTVGTVEVKGRISALLELGAGFHPDFSGRENIFINGAILGLAKSEITKRLDEIIAFSELGSFIDEPVRTYSSGMYMRLAFAVATFVDPDVLIIDEILAVGDEHFTRKSRARMEEFKKSGRTIVLVTHDLGTVESWCDLAAWIEDGRIAEYGDPRRVVAAYRQKVADRETGAAETVAIPGHNEQRWGNQQVILEDVRLTSSKANGRVFQPEDPVDIELHFRCTTATADVGFGIGLFRDDGTNLYGTNTFVDQIALPAPVPSSGVVRFRCPRLGLGEGNYFLDVAAHALDGTAYDYRKRCLSFAVRSPIRDVGLMRLAHEWSVLPAEPAGADAADARRA